MKASDVRSPAVPAARKAALPLAIAYCLSIMEGSGPGAWALFDLCLGLAIALDP
jgi:hypothetical protein